MNPVTVSPLPRRDQAPLRSICAVARLPRLGVAARSVPSVYGRAADRAAPRSRQRAVDSRQDFTAHCRLPTAHCRIHRRVSPLLDGTVGVEAVQRVALGAARQSIERQPASDRGLRRVGRAASATTPRRSTRSKSRSELDPRTWPAGGAFLVALTSIHWREAWKYGERAFRYCQHDVGHAIGALRVAASLAWVAADAAAALVGCAHVAALLGLDRDADYRRCRARRCRTASRW